MCPHVHTYLIIVCRSHDTVLSLSLSLSLLCDVDVVKSLSFFLLSLPQRRCVWANPAKATLRTRKAWFEKFTTANTVDDVESDGMTVR